MIYLPKKNEGHGLINELFEEYKLEFFKLHKVPYEVYLHQFAKADNSGKAKFDGRIYSTSTRMSGQQVMFKVGAYDICICQLKTTPPKIVKQYSFKLII